MGGQVGAVPAPTEAALLAAGAAAEQQKLQPFGVRFKQTFGGHEQRAEFGLQQPQPPIGFHTFEHGEMALVLQHGWRWHAGQLAQGDLRERGGEIEAADQLADVEQIEPGLPLQHRVDLIEQGIAVEGHTHVQRDGLADGQGNVSRAAGPGQLEHLGGDRGGPGLFRGGCGQSAHFRFHQGLLTLLLGIRQPDQPLLAGIGWCGCAPGGAIGPVPLSGALQICLGGVNIHQPTQPGQQLFPLLQLLVALLIGVAELLDQMDGFNGRGLLGAPLA